MEFVILVAVAVVLAVLPVMFAAQLVGAGRSTFGWSLLAVVTQSVVSGLARGFVSSPVVAVVVAVIVGSAVYAFILDTSFLRGLLIGIIATAIGVIAVVVLASLFLATGAAI